MTTQEVFDIGTAASKLNIGTMEVRDQIAYLKAATEFAEKLKPLVIKYLSDTMTESTFLFKM